MHNSMAMNSSAGKMRRGDAMSMGSLGRAIQYLGRHKRTATVAYIALLISTAAQLMVPQIIQNIMDALSNGVVAHELAQVPTTYLPMALGAGETTLLRMTMAYAMLANGALEITPSLVDRVQDRNGKTVYRHEPRACRGCCL